MNLSANGTQERYDTSGHDLAARLRATVAPDFGPENVAHDLSHLDRVAGMCRRLQRGEGGDVQTVVAAAYLHDYHRVVERQTNTWVRPAEVRDLTVEVMRRAGVPAELENPVLECIAATGKHTFAGDTHGAPSIEARILRDADALDAIGALGIARALMFGGVLREPLWLPDEEVDDIYKPGTASSVIHHFHEKLIKLADDMLTDTGRAIAVDRHTVLRTFLDQFTAEWAFSQGHSEVDTEIDSPS